jgi:hypothetical protein
MQFSLYKLPSGMYHVIYTVSDEPSCFYYLYLNESAIVISNLYERYSSNMMDFYNKTLEELIGEEKQLEPNELNRLKIKAYNLTILESSREFLYMLSHNNSQSDQEQNIASEMERARALIEKSNLNITKLYNDFAEHFYHKVNEKFIKSKESFYQRYKRKFYNNLSKFKLRYSELLILIIIF